MAVPKGFRNNINIIEGKIGPARRKEILDGIADKGTYLPNGVSEEDMDQTFIEFVENSLGLTIKGAKIPVLFLTLQRWSEFSKTWTFTDKYRDIQLPFITIVRKPDIQVGENQAGLWNIPGDNTYTYYKVPTWDGTREGMDLYKVPQPTSVNLNYEVRIFTTRTRDLNKFNSLVQRKFQSRQSYINVKGHPMPVHLETINDESNIDDFENRRFYVQLFEMKLLGYILDEEDFEVVPTINRIQSVIEIEETPKINNIIFDPIVTKNCIRYTIVFNPRSDTTFNFISQYNAVFNEISEIENLSRITIFVNGISKFDGLVLGAPLTINNNDEVTITVYKKNNYIIGKFELIGNTI
jgi:hypothetical protein